jgi:hypothetical protein
MKQVVIIQADTNDADYITQETELEGWNLEQLPVIEKVVKAIKQRTEENKDNRNWHNWPDSEYQSSTPFDEYEGLLTKEEINIFGEFAPYGENGIHTIESVRIVKIVEDIDLLNEST